MTDAVRQQDPAPTAEGELLELAMRVAGAAKNGEELEVYVSRGVETDVRAYEGEVESLVVGGVGRRGDPRGRGGTPGLRLRGDARGIGAQPDAGRRS